MRQQFTSKVKVTCHKSLVNKVTIYTWQFTQATAEQFPSISEHLLTTAQIQISIILQLMFKITAGENMNVNLVGLFLCQGNPSTTNDQAAPHNVAQAVGSKMHNIVLNVKILHILT